MWTAPRDALARAVVYRLAAARQLWDITSDRFAGEVFGYGRVVDVLIAAD